MFALARPSSVATLWKSGLKSVCLITVRRYCTVALSSVPVGRDMTFDDDIVENIRWS